MTKAKQALIDDARAAGYKVEHLSGETFRITKGEGRSLRGVLVHDDRREAYNLTFSWGRTPILRSYAAMQRVLRLKKAIRATCPNCRRNASAICTDLKCPDCCNEGRCESCRHHDD